MLAIGVDVGGTSIKSALIEIGDKTVAESYKILKFNTLPTQAQEGRDTIVKNIERSIQTFDWKSCDMIAVASAGTIDWNSGDVIFATNSLPGFTGLKLSKVLSERFGKRVIAVNDAVGALIGEGFLGAGKKADSAMMFTLGTGLGVSFLTNKTLDSTSVVDTKLGHFKLYEGGRECACGDRGCAERYVSATALKKYGNENLYQLFNSKDVSQKIVLKNFYKDFTRVCLKAIEEYSPERIIVGGGVIEMAEYWWQSFLKEYKSCATTPIVCASLGNKAASLGCVYAMANGKFENQ
ncbi:MAG: ROK family protein [Clostridia bacterium]|nr:ROK family protein [Clostridia bacterium]MDE7328179.1 ROK family protein [Clostridia bacterium]